QNDVTLKMPAFEWVHVQLHQQKGMISLSPPTICNSADRTVSCVFAGLRLDLRSVFALDSVTDIVSTSQNGNNDCLPDVSPSGTSLT
ncbi:hypothetical protein QS268_25260, partial [Escherichia coli]|nr:hypothetical protein [Escherichia coli]